MRANRLLILAFAALALGGCSRISSVWSSLVVGPDMDAAGPFKARHIVLTGQGPTDPPMRIDIRHGAADEATLTGVLDGTKPYLAGVTWHAFIPIVAETNDARMDYWIVGLNLTRTPDRSIYSVLRFPHGTDLSEGQAAPGTEYALLSCSDLKFARQPSFETEAHKTIALAPAPAPEAGDCEFNSLKEANTVAAAVLKNYDRVRHEKDAPAIDWRPVKIALD